MKKSIEELQEMIDSSPVKPSQTWRHYKGSVYKIEELLIDCNTNEVIVAYTCYDWESYTSFKFTRPLSEWFDEVEPGIQRFCRVRHRNMLMTDDEFKIMETITKNKKEHADEGLGRVRKLLGRISRRIGY